MAAYSDMVLNRDNVAMFTLCKFVVLLHLTSVELFCFTFKFCTVFFILN